MNVVSRASGRPHLGEKQIIQAPVRATAAKVAAPADKLSIGADKPSWVRSIGRATAVSQPDPSRHDHALYAVTVTGFSAKDVGEVFGKGELFIGVDEYPRMPWVKAGKNEWVEVQDPQPFTLSHSQLDVAGGTVTLRFELFDYDSLKSNDLLGTFEAKVKLEDLAKQGDLALELRSTNGNATAKATIRRSTIDPAQVPAAFVAKRGGDWARIAADYSTQIELQFRAAFTFREYMPEASMYWVRAPSGAMTAAQLQEDALSVRDAIVALDRDLPRRQEMVDAYNEHVRELAKDCLVYEQHYDAKNNPTYVLYYFPFEQARRFLISET